MINFPTDMCEITKHQFLELDKKKIKNQSHVIFCGRGYGTLRSTGEMICLLLAVEDEDGIAGIISDVMEQFNISFEDIERERLPVCSACGMREDMCDCDLIVVRRF